MNQGGIMRLFRLFLVVLLLVMFGQVLAEYDSGSCTDGSFSISFSSADFVTGLGWRNGSSRNISVSGSCSGCNWGPGVYGLWRNPLVEYYIGKSGGSNEGSYTCNGNSYTLYVDRRINAPSIDGTTDFDQYNASGPRTGNIDMSCHFNAWDSLGRSVGNHDYQVVAVESWSHGSGSAYVSVSGSNWYSHWVGSGSATFTCGGDSGSSGISEGKAPDQNMIPKQYALHQNFPNPFNPVTQIPYVLSEDGKVTLAIYNMLGHKVKTLVNESQTEGTHMVSWNAQDEFGNHVPSGVYIYKIRVVSKNKIFQRSQKMLLLK